MCSEWSWTYWLIAVAFRTGQLQWTDGAIILLGVLWILWYFLPRARATAWSTGRRAVELDIWSDKDLVFAKAVLSASELKSVERRALPVEWEVDKAVMGVARCKFTKWLQKQYSQYTWHAIDKVLKLTLLQSMMKQKCRWRKELPYVSESQHYSEGAFLTSLDTCSTKI